MLLFLAVLLLNSASAVPFNDLCSTAEVIPANQGFPYWTNTRDITGATTVGDPPTNSCTASEVSRSLWYTFTPTNTRPYTISSCADAPTATTVRDTVMAIFTSVDGCIGTFVEIADGCADDSCGPGFYQAAITATLQANVQYFIVVWQWGSEDPTPDNAALQLVVDLPSPPPNDLCENAVPLTLNQPLRGSTLLASNDYQITASCFSGNGQSIVSANGRDVVYSFTAPIEADYSFRVSNFNPAENDPVLYVLSACPTGPKPITNMTCVAAANRAVAASVEEIFCVHLTALQHVLVVVDDDPNNADVTGTSFIIEAALCNREIEPNNTTATASAAGCGIEGALEPNGDVDIYSLGVPLAGSRLFAMIDGEAANIPSMGMRVIIANRTLEYDTGNNDAGFGDSSPNVAGTILSNAPTYLRIEPPTLGVTQPYRLYAAIQPSLSEATVEVEPNNNLGDASRADNNYFFGTLPGPSPSADIDSYQFEAEPGDVVFISLDADPSRNPPSPINALVELLDEAGNVLVRVDDRTASADITSNTSTNVGTRPNSPGEAMVYRIATAATYYARVRISPGGFGNSGAGDYLLSITRNCVRGSTGRPEQPTIQAITALPNTNYQINAVGTPGATYRFLSSPDLGSWTPLTGSSRVANGDGSFQVIDPTPGLGQRFYQIVWP
jgi:hypothetical protein